MVDENRRRRSSNFSPGEADICREMWYTETRIDKHLTAAGGVGAGPRDGRKSKFSTLECVRKEESYR